MVPTADTQTADTHKEVREVITELQQLLNTVKRHEGQAAHNERVLDSLYKLKAKTSEAIELLKAQDAPVVVAPTPYRKKLHRLYQRL